MGDNTAWRGAQPQSQHAQHAADRKARINQLIADKRAAAKARCESGDHTLVRGICIVCHKCPAGRYTDSERKLLANFNHSEALEFQLSRHQATVKLAEQQSDGTTLVTFSCGHQFVGIL